MTPCRIQLRRTKGWRKPEGAVVVARPTRWGNPFVVHPEGFDGCEDHDFHCAMTAEVAVTKYRHAILFPVSGDPKVPSIEDIRRFLAGRDLLCWCDPWVACHADVLLELANS